MEKQKLTKQDLKSPDAFISNMSQIGDWAFENRFVIIGLIIAVALGAVVWASIGMYSSHKEDMAQEVLFNAEKKMQATNESFNPPPKAPDATKAANKDKPPEAPPETPKAMRTDQVEVDYKDSIPLFKEVMTQYPGTAASVVAALDLSHLYNDYKKYDDEIAVLEQALPAAKHPVTKGMVLDNLGIAYESKGDCNKAIDQWQTIVNDSRLTAFLGKAIINSSLCYEKLNQFDKALSGYEKFDNAEKEMTTLRKALASEYGINPGLPAEAQSPKQVAKFRSALDHNSRYQELESLLSDQDSIKAAKKYMKILKGRNGVS